MASVFDSKRHAIGMKKYSRQREDMPMSCRSTTSYGTTAGSWQGRELRGTHRTDEFHGTGYRR